MKYRRLHEMQAAVLYVELVDQKRILFYFLLIEV